MRSITLLRSPFITLASARRHFIVLLCLAGLMPGVAWQPYRSNGQADPSSPSAGPLSIPDRPARAHVEETYGKLPLSFTANAGQTDGRVQFISRGSGYSLFLTPTEAVLALKTPARAKTDSDRTATPFTRSGLAPELGSHPKEEGPAAVVRLKLAGQAQLPGKHNYLIGNDPAQWRTNVATYYKVKYEAVYPGIDLIYYGNQRRLEYDFVVAPGADPGVIRLGIEGADKVEIDARGDLILHTAGGPVRQHKPVTYQEEGGLRREVASAYVRDGEERVGFEVGAYDPSRPLIIDSVLEYSTFLGGSHIDYIYGIAVDSSGSAYVAGFTYSADFPTQNAYDAQFNSGGPATLLDAFVMKLVAFPALDLTVDPAVISGRVSIATVSLAEPAPAGVAVVKLASNNPAAATVPAKIAIAEGAISKTFTVSTKPVAAPARVDLSASYREETRTAALSVLPPQLVGLTLTASVTGPCDEPKGRVALNGRAPAGGVVIALSSANGALVPPTVTVPAGANSAYFSITPVGALVKQLATISATPADPSFGTTAYSDTMTVLPILITSLELTASATTGGNSVTGVVTLTCAAPPGGLVVSLSSSTPGVAYPTVASLTIAEGATTGMFTVNTAAVAAASVTTITAQVPGCAKSVKLTVE